MAAGDRVVYAGFGLAVAAALGAVAWLALSPATPAGAPPAPPVKKPPDVSKTQQQGGKPVTPAPDATPAVPPVTPPPRPPVEAVVRGSVQDGFGNPIPGARVEIHDGVGVANKPLPAEPGDPASAKARIPAVVLRDCFYLEPDEPAGLAPFSGMPRDAVAGKRGDPVATAETDGEGKFSIPFTAPRRVRVEAVKAGMSRAFIDGVTPNGNPIVLVLGEEAPLRGTCVDADTRTPVIGAVVVVRSGSTTATTRSADDGSFSLPGLPAGKYSVQAGAPGYTLTKIRSLELVPGRAPAEVPMGRGFTATVQAYQGDPHNPRTARGAAGPAGPPVEGALVVLLQRGDETYVTATTGADGTARFTGLCEGRWRVAVAKSGLSTGLARDFQFDVRNTGEQTRALALYPLVATPIRVVDTSGGPVTATLYWCGIDDEFDAKYSEVIGKTDAGGRISVTFDDGVPRKSIAWVVPDNGAAAVQVEPDDPFSGDEVVAIARAGRTARGRVTDQNKRPVANAMVGIEVSSDSLENDVILHTYTDADGRYSFPAVPFGDTYMEVETDDDWVDEDIDEGNRDNPLVKDFVVETWDEEGGEPGAVKVTGSDAPADDDE